MSAPGRTSPEDDPEGDASAPDADDHDPSSTDKPVLEWTKEDWARWIDSGGGSLPTVVAAGVETAEPEIAVTADEPEAEPTPSAPELSSAEAPPAAPEAAATAADEVSFEAVTPDTPDLPVTEEPAVEAVTPADEVPGLEAVVREVADADASAFEAVEPEPAIEAVVLESAAADAPAFDAVTPGMPVAAERAFETVAPEDDRSFDEVHPEVVEHEDERSFGAVDPEVVGDERSFDAVDPDVPFTDEPAPAAAAQHPVDDSRSTAAEMETPPVDPEAALEASGSEPATGVASPPPEPAGAVPEAPRAFHPAAGAAIVLEPDARSNEVTGATDGGTPEPVAAPADDGARQPAGAVAGPPDDGPADAALDQLSTDSGVLEAAPPSDGGTPGGETDDEWGAVSDHPWWESAPVLAPEPVVFGEDPPTQVEELVPPRPPEPVRAFPDRPPVRTTRPMPAPAPRPARTDVIRSQAPERSHRVRSAFGLLVVALSVGVVVAGLITVAIFVISLALRRAVG